MLPVRSAGSRSDAGLPAAYSIAARINTLHHSFCGSGSPGGHALTSRYYLLCSKSTIIGLSDEAPVTPIASRPFDRSSMLLADLQRR
jgi:hypothetical protein